MRLWGAAALGLALQLFAFPAWAAGPAADFSGASVGLQSGYGFGSNGDWCFCTPTSAIADATGGEGGVFTGVNGAYALRIGAFVLEPSLRLSYADLAYSELCGALAHCEGELSWLGEAELSAGVILWGNMLFAVSAGAAGGEVIAYSADEHTSLHDGHVYGARVERAMSDGWRMGFEYRFYDMSGENDLTSVSGGPRVETPITWSAHAIGLVIKYEGW